MSTEEIFKIYENSMKIYPDKSRLEVGKTPVAFHCDKFNTRIFKNMEDTIGIEDAGELIRNSAEKTTYESLKNFFGLPEVKDKFNSLSVEDKFMVINEIFKFLGYGSISFGEIGDKRTVISTKNSYIAIGWLENMKNWRWNTRKNPVCHDMRGYLEASMAIIFNKSEGYYKCVETKCIAAGADTCEFIVEAK